MGAKDINLTLFQGKQSMGLNKLLKYTIKISVVEQENLGLAWQTSDEKRNHETIWIRAGNRTRQSNGAIVLIDNFKFSSVSKPVSMNPNFL